jgi:hypothetical protein
MYWGAGPYLANTSRIQWSDSKFSASQTILVGATLSLNSRLSDWRFLRWQAELNPILLGSMGFDTRLKAQKNLSGFSGFFLGGEASARVTGYETGYAGAFQVGYLF